MDRVFQTSQLLRDPAARAVVDHLEASEGRLEIEDGTLYYDFPIFKDEEDRLYRSQVMLASRSHGILILQISEVTEAAFVTEEALDSDDKLSQLNAIIFGAVLKSRILRTGLRHIRPNLAGVLFYPNLDGARLHPLSLASRCATSFDNLDAIVEDMRQEEPLDDLEWSELRAIVEGAKGLIRPRERELPAGRPNSRGAILQSLEREVATFDAAQRRAALNVVDGPQRIRGLAGSGKTIVLAYKAAHLHLSDPEAKVLFTFYTKSLYDFVKRLITRFYRQYVDHDPDWGQVHVRHAWGGRNTEGVYYNAAIDSDISPLTLRQVRQATAESPFAYVCQKLLDSGRVTQTYDHVLMDEAQDFPAPFYHLCFELTKGGAHDRNIVWAYDELQNLFDVQVQTPQELFGQNGDGEPRMDLDRASAASAGYGLHDIVLRKCYRNAKEVLITAHALGFGIYSDTIVQTLEGKEHWEDVGYQLEEGQCTPGSRVVFRRPEENSPLSISDHQEPEEVGSVHGPRQHGRRGAGSRR